MSIISVLALANVATAAPMNLTHQGYLENANGNGLTGTHSLVFSLYDDDAATNPALWSETVSVSFDDGAYSVVLGQTSTLSDTLLDQYPLYLGLAVDGGGELLPRHELVSVPYAILAETCVNVDGGTVDAASVSVGGTAVIDSSGSLLTEADPTYSASDAANITSSDITAWNAAASTVNTGSAGWNAAASTVTSGASSWDATASTVTAGASGWDAAASTVTAGASGWDAAASTVTAGASSWDAAASTVTTGASGWDAAAATVTTGASSWDATAATVTAGASSWDAKMDVTESRDVTLTGLLSADGGLVESGAPSFCAYDASGGDQGTNGTFIAQTELFEHGGDNHSTSTGIFTAPYDGVYQVTWSAYTNVPSGRTFVNSSNGTLMQTNGNGVGISILTELSAGDTVWLEGRPTYAMTWYGSPGHNLFCMAMVHRR